MNKELRTFSICILLTIFNAGLMAQYYVNKEWISEGGVAENLDWASSTFDAEGNLIIVGNKLIAPGNSDILTTKYDTDGNTLWQQTFDGPASGLDYGVKAISDAQSNTFVAGTVLGTTSELDIVLIKYDPNGVLLWSSTWNGNAGLIDAPTCMLLDPNGHLYVGGITHASLTDIDYALVKFDANGQILWSSTYDHAGLADMPTGIELDVASNPVLTGGSASSVSNWDFATVIYNQITGLQMQVSRIATPGVGLDRAFGIAKDVNANLFITGYTENMGNWDVQTIKLDANFDLEWAMTYDGYGLEDAAKAIGTDDQGNVIVTGYSTTAQGGSEFITIKYDAQGVLQWRQNYRPKDPAWLAVANSIVVEADGACMVTGTMGNGTDKDFVTIKYSASGKLLWSKQHNGGNGDDDAKDIITDGQGNIFITGLSNTGAGMEYTTIKYTEYRKVNNILYDQNGDPVCVSGELIVKFDPSIMNHSVVDNKGLVYGQLEKFIPLSVVNEMCAALGTKTSPEDLMGFKIHQRMTTADSISISRLGEEVRVPEFWSSLIVTIKGMTEPFANADSLSQLTQWIHYAEPNYIYQLDDVPNDPLINEQSSMIPTANYPDADINMDPAWDIQKGQDYVRVGVIDDGIYWPHEDFGDGTFPGSKIKGGWNFAAGTHISNSPNPNGSHGTACAGIIGALRNNGLGVAGIAGGDVDTNGNIGCELFSLDVLEVTSNGDLGISSANAAQSIVEGSTQFNNGFGYGLHVLNCSWGGYSYSTPMYNAVRACYRNQCVLVGSKGNDGSGSTYYPTDYGYDGWALAVGANGTDGAYKNPNNGDNYSSNFGTGIDVVAPGTSQLIRTTIYPSAPFGGLPCSSFGNGYQCFSGTSAAAPHAAGVAALMLSEHNVTNGVPNNLAPEDVERILEKTATDIEGTYPSGTYPIDYDQFNGWGRIDAGAALELLEYPKYHVYHSDGTPTVSQQTFTNQQVLVGNNGILGSLAAGLYFANRVEVTHTYQNVFDPGVQILDSWGRNSSVVGFSVTNVVDAAPYQYFNATISGNSATVVATTNCWFILGQWYPAAPANLQTAYSLHLFDPNAVGVDEVVEVAPDLVIFPSPTSDFINIHWIPGSSTSGIVEMHDIMGKLVWHGSFRSTAEVRLQVPVSELSKGIYSVRLTAGEQSTFGRFIKN